MGVTISHTAISPLSMTSTLIGFVSFGFTLGTFFKVVSVNLTTFSEPAHDVHAYLTNLRTEFVEERANIRSMRRGSRRVRKMTRRHDTVPGIEMDEVGIKTMEDELRYLIKRFRHLERPFLAEGETGLAPSPARRKRRRISSVSPPRYSHGAYASPLDKSDNEHSRKGWKGSKEQGVYGDQEGDDDAYWAQRVQYAPFNMRHRFQWLVRKSEVQLLQSYLTRLQLRRVARQVTGMTIMMHEYGCGMLEMRGVVGRVDERVSRVVGVRRISPEDDEDE